MNPVDKVDRPFWFPRQNSMEGYVAVLLVCLHILISTSSESVSSVESSHVPLTFLSYADILISAFYGNTKNSTLGSRETQSR